MIRQFLVAIVLAFPVIASASSIDLSGAIYGKLAPTQDTIRILSRMNIAKGASLTIQSGTVVRLGSGVSIAVSGALIVKGTENDSVYFESLYPTNRWAGIQISNTSGGMGTDSTIFEYASISGAKEIALIVDQFNLVRISNSRFHHNRKTFGAYNGGAISAKSATFEISHSTFDSNRDSTSGGKGGAIYWNGGVAKIYHTVFNNDTADYGGAIAAEAMDSLFIENCRFSSHHLSNSSGVGGSLFIDQSHAYVHNSYFENGTSSFYSENQQGVAIFQNLGLVLQMTNDTITGYRGYSAFAPVKLYNDSTLIQNSVFFDNAINPSAVLEGGAIYAKGRAIVLSGNLAYHNTADRGSFATIHATGHAEVNQNTIVHNTSSYQFPTVYIPTNAATPSSHGNISWGNTPKSSISGIGAFNFDDNYNPYPEFVDSANRDYRLKSTSPYIDRGYALAPDVASVDLDGNPRSVHQGIDAGAYEYQGPREPGFYGIFTRDTLIPKGEYSISGLCPVVLDGVTLRIAAGTKFIMDNTCLEVYGSLRAEGTVEEPILFTSNTNLGWDGISIKPRSWHMLTDNDSSALHYVFIEKSKNASITHSSYAKASYHHLDLTGMDGKGGFTLEGLAEAYMDSSLIHGAGADIYSEGILYGSGTKTIGINAALRGTTVLHSWMFENTPIYTMSNAKIRNSTFVNSPIHNAAVPLHLIGCLLYGNNATTPAITQTSGTLQVYFSTITANAYYGIQVDYGYFSLKNSILWGNYGGGGIPQMTIGVNVYDTILNSIIETSWSGVGIVDEDPLFLNPSAGDYSLHSLSPAIDAADSTKMFPLLDSVDLAGNTRYMGATLDMGAFEYQSTIPVSIRKKPVWHGLPLQRNRYDLMGRSAQ